MMWFILGYVVSAVLCFGVMFGDFQGSYPERAWLHRREDAGIAAFVSAFGPLGLAMGILLTGFAQHGLRYRSISEDDSWAAFARRYPSLSTEDWRRE